MAEMHETRVSFSTVARWVAMVIASALITFAGPIACGGDDDGGGGGDPDAQVSDQPDAGPAGVDSGGGGTPDSAVAPAAPDRLWIVPWTAEICPGKLLALKATAIYEEEGGGETHLDITSWVNWSSDDETVATVDDSGMVHGEATGTTVITGEYEGASDTVDLTVIVDEIGGVMIEPGIASVAAGLEVNFTARLVTNCGNIADNVTDTATWGSNNTNVADLTSPGTFKTALQGSTTITVSAEGYNNSAVLTVTPAIPVTLVVTPPTITLAPTETANLTATVTFSDDSQEDVTADAQWTSFVPAIVEVTAPGEIKGVAVGGTEVFANYSANGESADGHAAVTVTE